VVVAISKFFAKFFHCHKFQRLFNYWWGKIQLNATHWTPNAFAVILADPLREGYKFHSLLGSVGKLCSETNFNFPAPPFNQISGICKNLADTWPATTRVLSRGTCRKREDPGNEVDNQIVIRTLNHTTGDVKVLRQPRNVLTLQLSLSLHDK